MLSVPLRECLAQLKSGSRKPQELVQLHAGTDLSLIRDIKVDLLALVGLYSASSVDDIEKGDIDILLDSIAIKLVVMSSRLKGELM